MSSSQAVSGGGNMSTLALTLLVLLAANGCTAAAARMSPSFYAKSCPKVETIVASHVNGATADDDTTPGPLLRLFFHDCFVHGGRAPGCGGCDASLLLNHTGSEQDASPNLTLDGFDIINDIKAELEATCPGTVSCADILALTARFSVKAAGGPDIKLPLGRRDSNETSYKASAEACLPDHNAKVNGLVDNFRGVGLNLFDVIALSGAHTIGQGHCNNIQDRLYKTDGTKKVDLSLNQAYAKSDLYTTCPSYVAAPTTVADIELVNQTFQDPTTNTKFDNGYYKALLTRRGMFTSDQVLYDDFRSRGLVKLFALNQDAFFASFKYSMVRMGNINALTGNKGIIRKVCFSNSA